MTKRLEPAARRVGVAGVALVGASVAGGAVSVVSGVNRWSDAWSAKATLAAPWPMLLIQAGATVAAVLPHRASVIAGASVLGLSAGVAGISGFFDGQLARSDLGAAYVAMQFVFVLVAWATATFAALRLREVMKQPGLPGLCRARRPPFLRAGAE